MKTFFYSIILFVSSGLSAQSDTLQKIVKDRKNSSEQQNKPYVILISIDGFRHDYIEKFNVPFLGAMSKQGVRAKYMLPSFPTLTFPNHYTLITGLYPSHHGLVGNSFHDRNRKDSYGMRSKSKVADGTWYGGTPLWVLAEQQKMLSASFYWVGSEADIKGVKPTYYYNYTEEIRIDKRIQVVVDWLNLPAEQRPHLITFYFPEVDHAGHDYGPDSEQNKQAVLFVDSSIQKLAAAVKSTGLDVNYILVSDHGMTKVNQEEPIRTPVLDSTKFVTVTHGELILIYAKNPKDIQPAYEKLRKEAKGYTVHLKTEMKKRLHYSSKDDVMDRIGDIILKAEWPYVFSSSGRRPKPGAHGFDQYLVKDMRTTFLAWGPAFKERKKICGFENIHVFPIVTSILDLKEPPNVDGKKKIARKILKK